MPTHRHRALPALALALTIMLGAVAACTSSASTSSSGASGPAAASGAAGGSGSPSGGGPATGGNAIVPAAGTLRWSDCTGQYKGMKCATLKVPLDYAHPGG